jgi:hypothetical protein
LLTVRDDLLSEKIGAELLQVPEEISREIRDSHHDFEVLRRKVGDRLFKGYAAPSTCCAAGLSAPRYAKG